ncbi:MAG TPA: histidine kinase [Steroidobacteraceae bacterium]|jgi:sensor histidine kinase YesM
MAADAVLNTGSSELAPRPILRIWLVPGWRLWLLLTLLFCAYNGLNAMLGTNPTYARWKPFLWETSSILSILVLLPIVVSYGNRFRLDARPRGPVIAAHAVGVTVFSTVHVLMFIGIRKIGYTLNGEVYTFGDPIVRGFYEFQKDLITYITILLIAFAFREFKERRAGELKAAQLTGELSEARLRHLTAQIEPHFLFNALNAISNRMHEDVGAADRMITHLGDLLRAAYESDEQVRVPLASEMGWLKNYTAMMAERFRGQLTFDLEVDPGMDSVQVPRMLLQPIVENAYRHGLAEGRGSLAVSVKRVGERICYAVSDDGVGLPAGMHSPSMRGTGLTNVSRRLELLYGRDYEFKFSSRHPRGTVVSLSFPAETR